MTLLSHSGNKAQMEQKYIGNSYHHHNLLLLLWTREKIIGALKINFAPPAKTYIGFWTLNSKIAMDTVDFNVLELWNSNSKPSLGQRMHCSIILPDGLPCYNPYSLHREIYPQNKSLWETSFGLKQTFFSYFLCAETPGFVRGAGVKSACPTFLLAVTTCSRGDGWS